MTDTDGIDVRKAAGDLAQALGGDWRAEDGHHPGRDAYVRSAAGDEGLHVRQVRNVQHGRDLPRLAISGERGSRDEGLGDFWPRERGGVRRTDGEITVSAARTPAQIARDVERRLLAGYREALTAARAAKAAHDAREAAAAELTARIASILGGVVYDHRPHTVHVGSWGEKLHGKVEVSGGDVHFDLWAQSDGAAEVASRIAAA